SPMPTNTTSPSFRQRAAVTAIISFGVYSEPIIDAWRHARRRTEAVLESRLRREIRSAVAHAVDELVEVPRELLGAARDRLPVDVELVVPVVIALGIRRMRAPGLDDDGVDDHARDHCSIRIGSNDGFVDELLDDHDHSFRCERHFLLDSHEAPDLRVA